MSLATIMLLPADQFFSLYGTWAAGVVLIIASMGLFQLRDRLR